MIHELDLRLLPTQAMSREAISTYLHEHLAVDESRINGFRILRRNIDARGGKVRVCLKMIVAVDEPLPENDVQEILYPDVASAPQVIVVGAGPGGLFAALRLIELGLRPVILERGKNVHDRKRDLAKIPREQQINPESNYCFGEGGAGAFSDGKLYTRSKKRGSVEKILRVFCQHGAVEDILVDAHPHIGTDRLPRVIENMRKTIERSGGSVLFEHKMTSLVQRNGDVVGVVAKTPQGEREFLGPVILATGHSARDVYQYFSDNSLFIEAKDIAVGVRLEHPSELITRLQYHSRVAPSPELLPPAEYRMATQVDGRGVYSFCMCPGGFVIPAATEAEQLVVNGMSPANRGTRWSNSGMVVELHADEIEGQDALRVMRWQRELEHLCWKQTRSQRAPAQRMTDFVNGRLSADLPKTSYAAGVLASPMHFWLPAQIAKPLQQAFRVFGKNCHGFLTAEASVIGVETRTSAPVRIPRENDSLHYVGGRGLFPCGEGAGYAGGIVSAAVDGERCAEAVKMYLENQ